MARRKIHTLMQLIINMQKVSERRIPLIISMLPDKDNYGILLALQNCKLLMRIALREGRKGDGDD